MARTYPPESTPDAPWLADEFGEPVGEWTLDELDRSGDLGTLRSAWAAADELNE